MFPTTTKILVVDDMITLRKLVRKTLFDLGFANVIEASDGDLAWVEIEKSGADPFGLVIADWNMPKMTGLDLLRKIRAAATPVQKLPFILLTAESEKSQVMEAIKAGVTSYITKPFSITTLSEKLQVVWAQQASPPHS